MIELQKRPGQRILELGGGSNRNPASDVNCDIRGIDGVDFQANFEEPLPIQSDEFDCVFAQFVLEHITYPKVPAFLKECMRVLRPGGRAVFVIPNTSAQIEWMAKNPNGWDGKDYYTASSELIFGTQDYEANSHKNFFNPQIVTQLFADAGFADVTTTPYNPRDTDMVIQAKKPSEEKVITQFSGDRNWGLVGTETAIPDGYLPANTETVFVQSIEDQKTNEMMDALAAKFGATLVAPEVKIANADDPIAKYTREELFDKQYFGGGGKVGGYAREGFWDYPVHELTFRHVMNRRPQSVLELGAARGYIGKRIQDAGVHWQGIEISKHCYMTRVADGIIQHDLCKTPWPGVFVNRGLTEPCFDLCFSIAAMEHVPEEFLPAVIGEMQRTCKRGLHGIDFGEQDDGFDQTHCSLHDKAWWYSQFSKYALGWPVEIVNKEELERGTLPESLFAGDGKVKLNIGSFTTMHHHGWINTDVHDLAGFAQQYQYKYLRADVRQGLPFKTGEVDLIHLCHFIEHLSYAEGVSFLRECRRVLKPDGAMRIICPNAALLATWYADRADDIRRDKLAEFDEINDGCANSPTDLGKFWALLFAGHQAAYDWETLHNILSQSGFTAHTSDFRHTEVEAVKQILKETTDMGFNLSLFVDAAPAIPS